MEICEMCNEMGIENCKYCSLGNPCLGWEDWSHFTEYQGYYEVVFWTPLIDMPRIEGSESE